MLLRFSCIFILVIISCSKPKEKDIVFDDFENANFNKWDIQGTAFNKPVHIDAVKVPIINAHGKFVAFSNTSLKGKSSNQGKLVSKEFTVNRNYIRFLIAGGKHNTRACVNLIINNKVVRVAVGENDHVLRPIIWDVSNYIGEKAVIVVLDAIGTSYGYNAIGHLIVDNVVFSDYLERKEIVFEDFENGTYNNWRIEGDAFVIPRNRTNVYYPITADGFGGDFFAFSFGDTHDVKQGKLTSKLFTIEHDHVKFLIGGGNHKKRTCLNLVIKDSVVLSAEGKNDGVMRWVTWDVLRFKDQIAQIEIVDSYSGGWGHIMADDLIFYDSPSFYRTSLFWIVLTLIMAVLMAIYLIRSLENGTTPKAVLKSEEFENLEELKELISASKIYIQHNVSIDDIMTLSTFKRSVILNLFDTHNEGSLARYLNSLRVEEFKLQLRDPSNKAFTLISIAKNCGFSSKTSFYRIFKSITNTTPSEYKKSIS